MKVRDGYKMTELGEIPQDWEVKKIVDGFERVTRRNNGCSDNTLTISGRDGLINQKEFFNKIVASKNTDNYYLMYNGEFAYNKSYSNGYPMGATKRLDRYENGIVSPLYICFKISDENYNSDFYMHYFESTLMVGVLEGIAQEGARNHGLLNVGVSEFFNLPIVFPPLPEQQRIAEILSSNDALISKTDELIEKTKEIKQGLMQELLTRGIGHTEFKDSELGRIPKDWEVKTLEEVCRFQGGFAFKSEDYTESGVKLAKITNVQQGSLTWEDISCLPVEFLDEYKDFSLNVGDVVMAMTRPIISSGIKVSMVEELDTPALLNQRVGRFVVKKDICLEYLYYSCFSDNFIKKVQEHSTATNQPNISGKQIESILIALPPIDEQRNIGSILSVFDDKIEVLSKRKQQLGEIKKGLMQDLLTGRVRVQDNIKENDCI